MKVQPPRTAYSTSCIHLYCACLHRNCGLGQLQPWTESATCLRWSPHGPTWPNRLAAQPHRGVYHALQAIARHPDALLNVNHFRDGNRLHAGAKVIPAPDLQRGCLIRLRFAKSLQPAQQCWHGVPHHAFSLSSTTGCFVVSSIWKDRTCCKQALSTSFDKGCSSAERKHVAEIGPAKLVHVNHVCHW